MTFGSVGESTSKMRINWRDEMLTVRWIVIEEVGLSV